MQGRGLNGYVVILGRRIPVVIAGLIGTVLFASIVGVVGLRNGVPLVYGGALVPQAVWSGQLWRLVTWVFFEMSPLGLLFGCLVIWWFGTELLYHWGAKRFLATYLGIAAAAGLGTAIVSLLWTGLGTQPYVGIWPVAEAVIIAWAVVFPGRQMLFYFILPLGGQTLIYVTIGVTVLFAIFGGLAPFVPHFIAQALILTYLRGMPLRRLWLRLRLAAFERELSRRSSSQLRAVGRREEEDDDDRPRWLH